MSYKYKIFEISRYAHTYLTSEPDALYVTHIEHNRLQEQVFSIAEEMKAP